MTYPEYIAYHKRGDAGVEERALAHISKELRLTGWDSFRLIYFYTMTYHIPSALSMLLEGERDMKQLKFRTDRRYVRCNGAFARLLAELNTDKARRLALAEDTQSAYDEVKSWFYFGRYAAFLFLEVYINVFKPDWVDNVTFGWESKENYTRGAIIVAGSNDRSALDKFLEDAKRDTADNAFAIETSLCAVAKFEKGTRWDGYYTERMLDEAKESRYNDLICRAV